MLAAELSVRLNEARENTPGLWPKTLALSARFGGGWNNVRGRQQPFPRISGLITVDLVAHEAAKLWKELVGTDAMMDPKKPLKITHINLGFKDVGWTEDGQQNIQGFFQKVPPAIVESTASEGVAGPSRTIDRQNDGRQRSASLAPGSKDEEVVILSSDGGELESRASPWRLLTYCSTSDDFPGVEKYSYTCPRCRKILSLPSHLQKKVQSSSVDPERDDDREAREDALASLRMEHDDWHFARDLSREENSPKPPSLSTKSSSPSSSAPTMKKRKQGKEPGGIAKFFVKKAKV